jgi:hypothetical protein
MHPKDTAARYDRIAQWWQTQHQDSLYGIAQLACIIHENSKENKNQEKRKIYSGREWKMSNQERECPENTL